jgi:hypothetical protein
MQHLLDPLAVALPAAVDRVADAVLGMLSPNHIPGDDSAGAKLGDALS